MAENRIKEAIDAIFEEAQTQNEVLSKLYRLVFPDWERISKIRGWPTIGRDGWAYICRKFQELDREKHPSVLPGGAWLNSGFSSADHLKPFEIDLSTCRVEYEDEDDSVRLEAMAGKVRGPDDQAGLQP